MKLCSFSYDAMDIAFCPVGTGHVPTCAKLIEISAPQAKVSGVAKSPSQKRCSFLTAVEA